MSIIVRVDSAVLLSSRWRSLFTCLFVIGLGGCGWHLQGSARLPTTVAKIQIDTQDAYSEFYRELRTQLGAAGAQVTESGVRARVVGAVQGSAASAVVHVKSDETGQRLSSVSARNRPEQYEVFYRVTYFVELNGAVAIPDQRMELTAVYSYDSSAVLAKQREQLSIQQALARDLAAQVLRRLASLESKPQAHAQAASGT